MLTAKAAVRRIAGKKRQESVEKVIQISFSGRRDDRAKAQKSPPSEKRFSGGNRRKKVLNRDEDAVRQTRGTIILTGEGKSERKEGQKLFIPMGTFCQTEKKQEEEREPNPKTEKFERGLKKSEKKPRGGATRESTAGRSGHGCLRPLILNQEAERYRA